MVEKVVRVPKKVDKENIIMKGDEMKKLIDRAYKAIAASKGECFCEDEEAKKLTTKDRKKLKSGTFCG